MARRRRGDESASFDSLLDTMTNVVGILVIVLVLTLLGVRDAVRRIEWQIPDISKEQLAELRKEVEENQERVEANKEDLAELLEIRKQIQELDKQIAELQKQIDQAEAIKTPADLEASVKELEKKRDELKKEIEKLEAQLQEIKEQLVRLPTESPGGGKVIRLPDPRQPIEGSQPVWFMCRYNRIQRMDIDELIDGTLEVIERSKGFMTYREGGKEVMVDKEHRRKHPILRSAANLVFDPEKVQEYFDQREIGNRDFRVFVRPHPNGMEGLFVTLRKGRGDGPDKVHQLSSEYVRDIKDMDPEKQYARFIVWPDSFEVYVRAREVAEHFEIPAGWILHTGEDWTLKWNFGINMLEEWKRQQEPPKPKPAAGDKPDKPAPPPPPTAPVQILD